MVLEMRNENNVVAAHFHCVVKGELIRCEGGTIGRSRTNRDDPRLEESRR